jgi:hypothetical protein
MPVLRLATVLADSPYVQRGQLPTALSIAGKSCYDACSEACSASSTTPCPKECKTMCPDLYYSGHVGCRPCNSKDIDCFCKPGMVWSNKTRSCVCGPNSGGKDCACQTGYITGGGAGICDECDFGYGFTYTTYLSDGFCRADPSIAASCPKGIYYYGPVCQPCSKLVPGVKQVYCKCNERSYYDEAAKTCSGYYSPPCACLLQPHSYDATNSQWSAVRNTWHSLNMQNACLATKALSARLDA